MTDPACKDCRFYQPSQSHSPRGYCHYNPPAHVSGRDMGYFVMVYGSDWCGRFAPKGQPEEHRRQIFDVYTGAVRDEQEGKKLPNVWGEEYNLLPNVLPREDAPPEKADESMDESDSEDSAMSMSEFMDWQEKKLLELLQDDREAVERYKKAFLQFIDDREKDEEARRRGPRMSDLFSPTIRIRPVVEEREEEEEPLKEREPAQTDWEADQITTHNERYAERVRNIGRLAQNAYQRKMDESAADLVWERSQSSPSTVCHSQNILMICWAMMGSQPMNTRSNSCAEDTRETLRVGQNYTPERRSGKRLKLKRLGQGIRTSWTRSGKL